MSKQEALPSVAVFGLGIIGSRAAEHIAAAGYPLRTWSRKPRERGDFEADAATASSSADIIAIYLKDVPAVRGVFAEIRPTLGTGKIVVNHATIDLATTDYLATECEALGCGFLNAPFTGSKVAAGKAALVAMEIWRDDVNAAGGLLGRPVELVYYDDQTNPSMVPGIYTKLINIDRVDLIVSGYGSNMIAPAMPIAMNYNRVFMSLFALAGNEEFNYDRYFQILPAGPEPRVSWSRGFFELAKGLESAPKTVALVGATGGGKSTIVSLVARFYEPKHGQVLINGVDYRQRSLEWLQSNLGVVLQSPHLFSGTVRENIRYGRLDATDEEIEAGARQYVRKVSGVQKTSAATEEPFERAVAEIAAITTRLLTELPPRKQPPKTEPPLRRLARPG